MFLFQSRASEECLERTEFTFHYVSISINCRNHCGCSKWIYIPLCFYFNEERENNAVMLYRIYIPLCFYFNIKMIIDANGSAEFTFHYVSISMNRRRKHPYRPNVIYIPLCFYFNRKGAGQAIS